MINDNGIPIIMIGLIRSNPAYKLRIITEKTPNKVINYILTPAKINKYKINAYSRKMNT
jgi:hypothetical protein